MTGYLEGTFIVILRFRVFYLFIYFFIYFFPLFLIDITCALLAHLIDSRLVAACGIDTIFVILVWESFP